jgi:hypothetical protein
MSKHTKYDKQLPNTSDFTNKLLTKQHIAAALSGTHPTPSGVQTSDKWQFSTHQMASLHVACKNVIHAKCTEVHPWPLN